MKNKVKNEAYRLLERGGSISAYIKMLEKLVKLPRTKETNYLISLMNSLCIYGGNLHG